ncbi:MAG: hypothetical protein IT168_27870 [Bryobacterales bacterium]|nr:hypothetical protein [Bryobacterales bacterium]
MTRRELLAALAVPPSKPGRGSVAFHYQAIFSEAALAWYPRFDLLVLGGILALEQIRRIRDAGASKLIAYEWSSAFYAGDAVSAPLDWQNQARTQKWVLNTTPVSGAAAENGKGAYWYDVANPELRQARARFLANRIEAAGYDGIFFDTPGFEQLPPPMRNAFTARYPAIDYNRMLGSFFAEVRRALPKRIVFLNQGFRQPDIFLPHADYDLTESYFTALDAKAGTRFREWHDDRAPWECVKTPLEQLILKPARRYPNVKFVHLNYAGGNAETVRRAAIYSYCCAKLFNHQSYLMCFQDNGWERADCYFQDLGKPVDTVYREEGGRVSRRYERATVAIENGRGLIY